MENNIEPVEMEVLEDFPNKTFDPSAIYLCNLSNNTDPEYTTPASSGMDLRAYLENINTKLLFNAEFIDSKVIIHSGGRALIPTGLHMALPFGLEGHIRSRSGLALKHGVHVLNSPGTLDSKTFIKIFL